MSYNAYDNFIAVVDKAAKAVGMDEQDYILVKFQKES